MGVEDYTPVLLWFGGQLILSAAIWGAIRSDIRNIHERIGRAEHSTSDAHSRIDRLLLDRRRDDSA